MRLSTKLVKFVGLTFAVSWVLWSLVALVPPNTPLRTALFLPGTFAPAFVALWLAPKRQELIDRIFKWQVPGRWYVFAVEKGCEARLSLPIGT